MSQENVERAQRAYSVVNAAYKSGDFSELSVFAHEWLAEDFVLRGAVLAGGEEWHGVDGLLRFFVNQMEAFERMWIELVEFVDISEDTLVAVLRLAGRARYSGLTIDLPMVHVSTIDSGRLKRIDTYRSKAEALEAVGLHE
jgi:SnoaL-like domain